MKKLWPALTLLTLVYLFFRVFNLTNNLNFSADQGQILLKTYEIWQKKEIALIGPPTSFTFEGRYFFHGPAVYYLLAPMMALGGWQVLAGSAFIIGLNLVALWLIFFSGKKLFGPKVGFLSAFGFAIFPEAVYYSRFVWNPNFLPLTGALILCLVAGMWPLKTTWRTFLIGFLFGLGLQFHFQTVLLILVAGIYWISKSKNKFKTCLLIGAGFVLGYLPLILFELRNNFYNLRTIWFVLKFGGFNKAQLPPSYYFLIWLPFLFVFGTGFLFKLAGKQKWVYIIFAGLFLWWFLSSWSQTQGNRGMPTGWRYPYAQKASQIIEQQKLTNVNVADLLSGDTRAYAQRYLLTVKRVKLLDVDAYPQADYLFVISRDDAAKVAAYPVWEIQSFNGQIKEKWQLDERGIFWLYLFSKK
jgi:hypothetical protein